MSSGAVITVLAMLCADCRCLCPQYLLLLAACVSFAQVDTSRSSHTFCGSLLDVLHQGASLKGLGLTLVGGWPA